MDVHQFLSYWSRADWQILDPGASGAISKVRTGICDLKTSTSETRTLAAPIQAGLLLGLNFLTDGGDCVVTVASDINAAGNNIITFNDAGDFVLLFSRKIGSVYAWVVVVNDGASLSG